MERNNKGNASEDKDLIQEAEQKKLDILNAFLGNNYTPVGITENKVLKTSEELAYDLQELVNVSLTEISKALSSGGYQLVFIQGKPYWVMYEKDLLMF